MKAVTSTWHGQRLEAIDVTRGLMMLVIVWSHALTNVAPTHGTRIAGYVLSATIGFTTISGLLVGWFVMVKRRDFERVTSRYALQAARLLLIAHPVLAIIQMITTGNIADSLRTLYITDTLALLFLFVVPIIDAFSSRHRLWIGIALLAANTFLDDALANVPIVHELLCGTDPNLPHGLLGAYGVVPLAGAFLVGSWFGAQLSRARFVEQRRAFSLRLVQWGALLGVLSAVLVGAWALIHHHSPELGQLLYPEYEKGLYPLYLGFTLVVLAGALRLPRAPRVLLAIGKASLFIYVAQYVLVQMLPALAGYRGTMTIAEFVLLCTLSLPLLGLAAIAWNRWVKRV